MTSTIHALHARFESASAECNRIDMASNRATGGDRNVLLKAIDCSIREQDALRLAMMLDKLREDVWKPGAAVALGEYLQRRLLPEAEV